MFDKDILIVDFEVTGFNVDSDEAVQLGFVLLDKNTLKEKKSFCSWIKPEASLRADLPGFKWANITEKYFPLIIQAPSLKEVASRVQDNLLEDFTFASWNVVFDFFFWKKLLKEIKVMPKTANLLDLWTLAYITLLQDSSYEGDFSSKSVFQHFRFPSRQRHDALEDARFEAELLRRLVKKLIRKKQ